jgi:hypothetical protein
VIWLERIIGAAIIAAILLMGVGGLRVMDGHNIDAAKLDCLALAILFAAGIALGRKHQ